MNLVSRVGVISWPKTGESHDSEQFGLIDKGPAIKRLVVCNSWDVNWGNCCTPTIKYAFYVILLDY